MLNSAVSTQNEVAIGTACADFEIRDQRAFWRGQLVPLTFTEFKIVQFLATVGRDVTHREIYDVVRAPGFMAGNGEDGIRANVRTFIKRIRAKFWAIDERFDRLATYSGFGYRWR